MKQSSPSIARNYIYNTLYQILILLTPLLTTPYISRVLGADGIGVYSYTQSIASYFVLLGAVGTTLYGQREIAYVCDNPDTRTKIFWEIVVFRFVAVLLCTLIYFFTFGFDNQYSLIYRILTIEVFATAIDISWFFMGMENFRIVVIRNVIIRLISIALIFVLVQKPEDVPLYTICCTFPIFIGNASMWFSVHKYLTKRKIIFVDILKHIKPIFILFLPQLATEVYVVLDKTMLGLLASDISQVGYYTQASKIVKLCLAIITSLGTVMLPAMSFAFSKGDEQLIKNSVQSAFRFVFMIGFAILFGLCGISKNFVPVFFGDGYDPVSFLMVVISPILILIGISNVIGKQYLLPTKQQCAFTASVVSGACVNFILNLLLIPKYNAIGASIATVVAELSVTAIQIFSVRKQMNVLIYLRHGVKYMVYGLAMGGLVYIIGLFINGIPGIVLQVIVGMMTYIIILLIAKDELLVTGIKSLSKKLGGKMHDS